MFPTEFSRRDLLAKGGLAAGAGLALGLAGPADLVAQPPLPKGRTAAEPFGYCLNTSTIREQKIGLIKEVELAAKVGYQAIEPWIREIDQFVAEGGSLPDLRKRIADAGLTVESAIGFAEWIVDDDARREKGMAEARRCMDLVAQLGGTRLAAPPSGATKQTDLNLHKAAERYRTLLELGDSMGVVPQVEVWGFSTALGRLGETALVAIESGHPKACLLPDVYHLFKGGSDFNGLKLLSGSAMHVFHVNDYPASPSRAEMNDSHRVYPGDGVAPLAQIIRGLHAAGFRGYLSLELFNKDYWQQDPELVARTGLEKTRSVVRAALS